MNFAFTDMYAGIGYYQAWAGYNEWASYYASAGSRLAMTRQSRRASIRGKT
jgi:hypothetical protein